jgi:hypothetical protein
VKSPALGLAALALAGCATAASAPEAVEPRGECRAEPAQVFIGRKADAATGAELLKATGALRIRWVPPRTAVTMDFQPDRLTVYYNDEMVITRTSCT